MTPADAWLPIPSTGGLYEASPRGQIRKADGAILGQWFNDQGYCLVRLNSPRRLARVHRLIAETFLPNPSLLPAVNHRDNDRANNALPNLEWCTQAENLQHARNQGRLYKQPKGLRSPRATLTDKQVLEIRSEYRPRQVSLSALAKRFSISKRTAGRIISGEHYAHVR